MARRICHSAFYLHHRLDPSDHTTSSTAPCLSLPTLLQPGTVQYLALQVLQCALATELASGSPESAAFLNRLFNTLGWALTEFSAAGGCGMAVDRCMTIHLA